MSHVNFDLKINEISAFLRSKLWHQSTLQRWHLNILATDIPSGGWATEKCNILLGKVEFHISVNPMSLLSRNRIMSH